MGPAKDDRLDFRGRTRGRAGLSLVACLPMVWVMPPSALNGTMRKIPDVA